MFHINIVFIVLSFIAVLLIAVLELRNVRPHKSKLPTLTPSMFYDLQRQNRSLSEFGAVSEQRRTGAWARAELARYRDLPANVRDTGEYPPAPEKE